MKTRTDQIIEDAMKTNSMYIQNSVVCNATMDEMNAYCQHAASMQRKSIGKQSKMPYFDTTTTIKKNKPRLVIEILESNEQKRVLKK